MNTKEQIDYIVKTCVKIEKRLPNYLNGHSEYLEPNIKTLCHTRKGSKHLDLLFKVLVGVSKETFLKLVEAGFLDKESLNDKLDYAAMLRSQKKLIPVCE